MGKLEQLQKYYRDMRRWLWVNSDLHFDPEFDIRVIDAPLNLSRFDFGFMWPHINDAEGRSVWRDIAALGLDRYDFASIAAYSHPAPPRTVSACSGCGKDSPRRGDHRGSRRTRGRSDIFLDSNQRHSGRRHRIWPPRRQLVLPVAGCAAGNLPQQPFV
jgi:hypothetical protein